MYRHVGSGSGMTTIIQCSNKCSQSVVICCSDFSGFGERFSRWTWPRVLAREIAKSDRLGQRLESGKLRAVAHQCNLMVDLDFLLAIGSGLLVRNVWVRGGQKRDFLIHL